MIGSTRTHAAPGSTGREPAGARSHSTAALSGLGPRPGHQDEVLQCLAQGARTSEARARVYRLFPAPYRTGPVPAKREAARLGGSAATRDQRTVQRVSGAKRPSKAKHIGLGALIGSVVPGLGTAIGAAIGYGLYRHKKKRVPQSPVSTADIQPPREAEMEPVATSTARGRMARHQQADRVPGPFELEPIATGPEEGPATALAAPVNSTRDELKKHGVLGGYKPRLFGATEPNLEALKDLFRQYPDLPRLLRERGTKIHLAGTAIGLSGLGGMFTNNEIHLEGRVGFEPRAHFLRTLVHEMGHATFQQSLIRSPLARETSKAQVAEGAIADEERAKLSSDGQALYRAWRVLRGEGGRQLHGVDVLDEGGFRADDRRTYQAATFEEFCAESFMHMAVEEESLRAHIEKLRRQPDTPADVMAAWDCVWSILQQYKGVIQGARD